MVVTEPSRAIRDIDGNWRNITDPTDPDYEKANYIKNPEWFKYYKFDEDLSLLEEPNLSMNEYKAKKWELDNCTDGLLLILTIKSNIRIYTRILIYSIL